MTRTRTTTGIRRERAAAALATLADRRSQYVRLTVQCRHAHHLAAVYATTEGLVYVARTGPHGHGAKDFIDTGPHGSRSGAEYVDLLGADAGSDDALPAWCDCGPRTLSRRELADHLVEKMHSLRVQ